MMHEGSGGSRYDGISIGSCVRLTLVLSGTDHNSNWQNSSGYFVRDFRYMTVSGSVGLGGWWVGGKARRDEWVLDIKNDFLEFHCDKNVLYTAYIPFEILLFRGN